MHQVHGIDCWGWDLCCLDSRATAGDGTEAELRHQCFLFSAAFLEMEEDQMRALVNVNSALFINGFLCFRSCKSVMQLVCRDVSCHELGST